MASPRTPSTSPHLPIDEKPPSLLVAEPSKESTPKPASPKPLTAPTSFSEWQLLSVLQRANLVQYYDIFIAQGGDDINQIMQCDEQEFLEIMSLVGMLSKPLHVRRFQRALTEFSKDQTAFNLNAIQQIGPPPPAPQFPIADPMSYLMPGLAATLNSLTSSTTSSTSQSGDNSSPAAPPTSAAGHNSVALESGFPSAAVVDAVAPSGLNGVGATANVCAGQQLLVDVGSAGEAEARPPSPLLVDDNTLSGETNRRLAVAAQHVFSLLPIFQPKLVQNKKRVSRDVLDLIAMPLEHPTRADEYRKFSAIYGRFDAKRKPEKNLTLHEVMVNEAATQLCLLMPALLTRRDELFTLSRQVVKEAGLTRKRRNGSPSPALPPSPPPADEQKQATDDRRKNTSFGVDSWAASRLRLSPRPPSSSISLPIPPE